MIEEGNSSTIKPMKTKDYQMAQQCFRDYVKNYDVKDGMVKLKTVHTFHVVDIAEMIAKDLKLNEEDLVLAKIIALLHDIGRFEQIRRYHTFYDSKSVNHALLGVEVLKENNLIAEFVKEENLQKIVLQAIANHNRFQIDPNLDERTLLHSQIVRDADKTDIFRVRAEDPLIDVVGYTEEEMNQSTITKEVYEEFQKNHVVLSKLRKTPLDAWVSATAFIFDYNFVTGLKILRDKKRIDQTMNRIHCTDPITSKQLEEIRNYANTFISQRIADFENNSMR